MRELHVGGIEFALPGVEHWHGASPTEGARHINQGLRIDGGSGTFWMEEVSSADYLGKWNRDYVQNEIPGNWRTLK